MELQQAEQVEQIKASVQSQTVAQAVEVHLAEEISSLAAPLAQKIKQAETQAHAEVQNKQAQEPRPDNEPEEKDVPEEEVRTYSVDGEANGARLAQVQAAGERAFADKEKSEEVLGRDVVSVMEGKKNATTSSMVRDESKDKTAAVGFVDGSDDEWRAVLAGTRGLTRENVLFEAGKIIRNNTAVQVGRGESVTEEDKDRVRNPNYKNVARQLLAPASSF